MTIDYDMIPDYKNGVPEWMIYMTNAQYTTEDEREKSFLNLVWLTWGKVRILIVLF